MIAFEVSLNGKLLTVAGGDDMGVIVVSLLAKGQLGPRSAFNPVNKDTDVCLHVGGMTRRKDGQTDEHADWTGHRPLGFGDEVIIRLIEVENADTPAATRKTNGELGSERHAFEYVKEHYFRLRDKFEDRPEENQ